MAKKKGKCQNFDGCSLYDQVQEVDELDEFVCRECGHELEGDRPRRKKSNPLPLIIGGAVVVTGIIAGAIFALSGGDDEVIVTPVPKDDVAADSAAVVEEVIPNRNDTLVIINQNARPEEEEVVEEVSAEEAVVEETPAPTPIAQTPAAAADAVTRPAATTPAGHSLSYGSWSGGWKNGQPHGTGTLTYSTSRVIDSRDPKGRVAQPGEYIVGEWDNGHLVQGRWFKKNGTKEAVVIGKVG